MTLTEAAVLIGGIWGLVFAYLTIAAIKRLERRMRDAEAIAGRTTVLLDYETTIRRRDDKALLDYVRSERA